MKIRLKQVTIAASVTCLLALAYLPARADPFKELDRLFKRWGLFQGVQISGTNEFTFQQHLVEGSVTAFQGQRWDTEPFLRRSSLSIEGPIWKEFSFKADFSASGYGPAYSRWVVGYVGHDTALYYGDLNIDLSGNQFAAFTKPVRGWQLDQRIGKGLARAFYSRERAITRYQVIPGNNTSGPYFLTYTPVMEGTEVVKVNEQRMIFGVDYRLDYQTGQLWFEVEGRPPRIIPDTATITVSYQSAGYESQGKTLYGGRILMPFFKDRLQVGMTMIRQERAGNVGDTVGYQEDIFYGSGSVGPFDVNFRPIIANGTEVVYKGRRQVIQQALIVLVDNVEQAEGVDFDAYRSIGRIIFRRAVPPTSLVVIRYFYDLSTTLTPTDKTVMGVDLSYRLSPKLTLQAEWGRSDSGIVSAATGDALRASLAYSGSRLRFQGEYRDISPTFSFLDTVGFYKQDRGYELNLDWQPLRYVSLTAHRSDLKSSQGYAFGYSGYTGFTGYSGYTGYGGYTSYAASAAIGTASLGPTQTTTTGLSVQAQRNDLQLRLQFPDWPTLSWQWQEMSNVSSTSDSRYGSQNISLQWTPKRWPLTLSGSFNKTSQDYVPQADTTAATGGDTSQYQWSLSYRLSEKLSLSWNQSRNRSTARGQSNRSSSALDQFSLRWSPSQKFEVNFDMNMTSSVGTVSSGLYSGWGSYGSYSGYSGYYRTYNTARLGSPGGAAGLGAAGIADGGGLFDDTREEEQTNRYTDSGQRLSLRYSPSQRLSFDLGLMRRKYTSGGGVGYLADSDQLTGNFSTTYMLSEALSFSASYTSDQMKFLEENRGTVRNNTMSFAANYRPPGSPWSFGLTYNILSGSSPTYIGFGSNQRMRIVDNNMSDLQARISYALDSRSEIALIGQLSSFAGGYANFDRQQLEIGYRRQLGKTTALTFGYRFMRNVTNGLPDPRYGNTSLTPENQNYLANTFLLTLTTQFTTGVGGRASSSGMFGGSSNLAGFTGYRAGLDVSRMAGLGSYGTPGGWPMMSGYGGGPLGSGYRSPFGTSPYYGSYGPSTGLGDFGAYGGGYQPRGYDIFGGGYGSQGGFTQGLGDISGRGGTSPGGMGPSPRPGPMPPGSAELPAIEDWQALDDLPSLWW